MANEKEIAVTVDAVACLRRGGRQVTGLSARPEVFPLPLCGLPHQPTSASRRSWQRYGNVVAATNVANCTISALNELAVSFSDRERPFDFKITTVKFSISIPRKPETATIRRPR